MKRFIFILLILSACGPTHDLKKAKRLIERAKAHGAVVTQDTVYSESVIYRKGDSTTVFVPVKELHDTTIVKFQDRIKITYRVVHDTLREHIECPGDSIFIKVPVAVNQTINCPPQKTTWRTVSFVLIGLLALLIVIIRK